MVPDAAGGTLVIDSRANGGGERVTGTVDISWSGATDLQWHFGAVAHNDGDGVIQRTWWT